MFLFITAFDDPCADWNAYLIVLKILWEDIFDFGSSVMLLNFVRSISLELMCILKVGRQALLISVVFTYLPSAIAHMLL